MSSHLIDETRAPVALVSAFYEAWAVQDIEAALTAVDEEFVWQLPMAPDVVPFAGVADGKAAFRQALTSITELFEFVLIRPNKITLQEDHTVSVRLEYMLQHRLSGATYQGSGRDVWRVRNGRLSALVGYHDSGRFEAFMRFVSPEQKFVTAESA